MNELLYQNTFDVLQDVGFGQVDVDSKEGASVLGGALSILGPTVGAPWIVRVGFALFPRVWNFPHWFKFLQFTQSIIEKKISQSGKSDSLDIASFFIEDGQRPDADQISREAIGGECGVILLAGSTSGPSLILLFYCLARWPEQAEKIRQELRNVDYRDMNAFSALPHLTATIHESLRLYPAGPTFGSRITPPEGINCDGTYIPGGVKIVAPRYSLGRQSYEKPLEFIPERWYSQPELIKDKRTFAPFSMGRNSCAGKKVAMAQLRLTAAMILSKYSIKFAPGTSNGILVEKNMRDQLTPLPGELELVFEKLESPVWE
ncbi:cytochrome P450 [Periconia macrospinosa]|uniref:Cytochrome P450 n=1 Tax=Periconia macrospinosa TaxID=97972 RepID=A0A2V1CZH5_9PLEO|nr:cytochrome P450 [Periconia macrospinosa]